MKKIICAVCLALSLAVSVCAAPADEVKEIFGKEIKSAQVRTNITVSVEEMSDAVKESDFGKILSDYSYYNETFFNTESDGKIYNASSVSEIKLLGRKYTYFSWTKKDMTANPPVYETALRSGDDTKFTVYDYVKYNMADSIASVDNKAAVDKAVLSELENAEITYNGMYGDYTVSYSKDAADKLVPALVELLAPYSAEFLNNDKLTGSAVELVKAGIFAEIPVTKHIVCSADGLLTADDTVFNLDFNLFDIAGVLGEKLDEGITEENGRVKFSVKIDKKNYGINSEQSINYPALNINNSTYINPRYSMGTTLFADEVNVFVNYKRVSFDVLPRIVDDRTLVPIRYLAYALGFTEDMIKYDEETENIELKNGTQSVKLTVGSKTAYVNGEQKELDVPANVYDGRTLVPLRFISEAFGCSVEWTEFTDENNVQTGGIVDIIK